jgi:ATP-dependent DNA helicase RecG
MLSQRLYAALGAKGVYTRKRGLDRETNKALLEQHLRGQGEAGSPLSELRQVLPSESARNVQSLLAELREEGRVTLRGQRRWARWVIASPKAQEEL